MRIFQGWAPLVAVVPLLLVLTVGCTDDAEVDPAGADANVDSANVDSASGNDASGAAPDVAGDGTSDYLAGTEDDVLVDGGDSTVSDNGQTEDVETSSMDTETGGDDTGTGGADATAGCTNEATGAISAPDDGADVSAGGFTVSATVADVDGVTKVTIAVDALQDCKFSFEPTEPQGEVQTDIEVALGTCGLSDGLHELGLWAKDECGNASLLDSIWVDLGSSSAGACSLESVPPLLTWQADYEALTDCTCDGDTPACHAIYVGSVDGIAGNLATLRFRKAGGGLPTVPVNYWVVVLAEEQLSCGMLDVYVERTSGTWDPADGELVVPVNVWPDADACGDAPLDDVKRLALITGGSGDAQVKRWFTKTPLTFKKVDPDTGCSPSVTSVAPLAAKLGASTTFTVEGSCLPASLAAWIDECAGLAFSMTDETEAQFSCTPSWSTGLKDGVIKDKPGGAVLHQFSVNVSE